MPPTTNNATERVIRIFTQHYKTFCGFENINSARLYPGGVREGLPLHTFLRRCPGADSGQVSTRTGWLRGPEAANGSPLPWTGPAVARLGFQGACPQCMPLPT
jgi:hypothetical protein